MQYKKSDLSDKIKKTRILPSCNRVSITVWLHHLESNETPWEKANWELCKNAAYRFGQIMEAAPLENSSSIAGPELKQTSE